jgi:16S rRNA G966 N2-methylase RsmD
MPKKGQNLSKEAIEQMKLAKLNKMKSKLDWDLVEPYLDVQLQKSSRNRKLNFITFRELRELVDSGKSFKDISRSGVSKHLVQFFSNFLQGKIILDKDTFYNDYRSGLPLNDIADRYNISKSDITFLRQLYNFKATGFKYQNRKNTEVPLTQRQKEILYGSLMGDAKRQYVNKSYNTASVGFSHSSKQKKYLLWKFNEFKSVVSEKSLKESLSFDPRHNGFNTTCSFYTHANTDVENILSEFYKDDKREPTRKILDNITPLGLAVWYQDDGSTDIREHKPQFSFCTDSFSKESCELIVQWFKERYGIDAFLADRKSNGNLYYRVKIRTYHSEKFVDLVSSYVLPMFYYKINKNDHTSWKQKKNLSIHDIKECPLSDNFMSMNKDKQDEWVDNIVFSLHHQGFRSLLDDPKNHLTDMRKVFEFDTGKTIKEDCIDFSSLGNIFLMYHFPNFWTAKAKGSYSPREIFNNEIYLKEIVREVILNDRIPIGRVLLRKLRRYRGNKCVSGFMPCIAKSIYDKYCDEGSNVLDFCAGYGGRLFGASASEKVKSYHGIEINLDSFSGLHNLRHSLYVYKNIKTSININNQDSLLGMKMFVDNTFDFCFTSPPYFDAELYDTDSKQSSQKYGSYGEWFDNYLIPCVVESSRVSKKVAINVANTGAYPIADDLKEYLESKNMLLGEDRIKYPKFGGGNKFEPIFVIS